MTHERTPPYPTPPVPVRDDAPGDPWLSVMVPTFRCASTLRETLGSVLTQTAGDQSIEVVVVDNASDDGTGEVAREFPGATLLRNPTNLGMIGNFHACVSAARGRWIHILHGDDVVYPGFYDTIRAASIDHPDLGLIATRALLIDAAGSAFGVSAQVPSMRYPTHDGSAFHAFNPLSNPGVVVNRSAYRRCGGYIDEVFFTSDWEMWHRLVRCQGGLVVDRLLAGYRIAGPSMSSLGMRNGRNLCDVLRVGELMAEWPGPCDMRPLRDDVKQRARNAHAHYLREGDQEAASANLAVWRRLAGTRERLRFRAGALLRRCIGSMS
jgi:hypothetical protein